MSTYQTITTTLPDGMEGDALQFAFDSTEWYTMPPCIPYAGKFIFSVWMKGKGTLTLHLSNTVEETFTAEDDWKRVYISGEFAEKPETTLNFAALSGTGTITVCMGQVEEGNTPSTYQDAPEDVEGKTNDALAAESERLNSLIQQTAESIIQTVSAEYTTKTDAEELRQTLQTELSVLADGITAEVSKEITTLREENGVLQEKVDTYSKVMKFNEGGLSIEMPEAPQRILIDNDSLDILVNEVPRQHFDAEGNAEIPSLRVTEKFEMFGDTWIKNEEGIVMLI